MEALWILGTVVLVTVVAALGEPWMLRRAARRGERRAEDRRLEAVFAVMRLYGEAPPPRGRRRR